MLLPLTRCANKYHLAALPTRLSTTSFSMEEAPWLPYHFALCFPCPHSFLLPFTTPLKHTSSRCASPNPLQYLIVQHGGSAFETVPLSPLQWLGCVGAGAASLLVRRGLTLLKLPAEHEAAQRLAAGPKGA